MIINQYTHTEQGTTYSKECNDWDYSICLGGQMEFRANLYNVGTIAYSSGLLRPLLLCKGQDMYPK